MKGVGEMPDGVGQDFAPSQILFDALELLPMPDVQDTVESASGDATRGTFLWPVLNLRLTPAISLQGLPTTFRNLHKSL
jgi:hypothetical protein